MKNEVWYWIGADILFIWRGDMGCLEGECGYVNVSRRFAIDTFDFQYIGEL